MKLCRAVSDGAAEILGVQERGHSVTPDICHEKIFATAVTRLGRYALWQPVHNFRGTQIMVLSRRLSRGCKTERNSRERD